MIVDDEKGVVSLLKDYFTLNGYETITASNGAEAIERIAMKPDLILLDVNMPDMDGLTVCEKIRDYVTCPILFLTAKIEDSDKIKGFSVGGDDYIIKPFSIEELGARVAAHLRRQYRNQVQSNVRFYGNLAIDYSAKTISADGKQLVFAKKEFENIIGIVNIPSFAFSVCAVGLGMMKSLTDGLIIYLITVLGSIISSRLFCQKGQNIAKTAHFSRQNFSLTNSIKNAGFSSLVVSSYIIFFSIILKLLSNVIENERIGNILSYLKDISQYMADKPEDEIYLKKELEQIKFIHPESVLNLYLNQQEFERTTTSDNKIIFPFRFNLSQRKALENALSSQISVIEGPPGTGKTQTILNIIANLVAVQGKTVAVVSNNNEAVKNVLEKMEKKGYDFLLALLGRTSNQEKFFENMPRCQVEGWNCQESTQELMQQVEDLNKRINRLLELDRECMCLRQEVRAWSLEQKHFHEYYDRQEIDSIANLPLFQEKPEKILNFLAEYALSEDKSSLGKLRWRLKLLFKYRISSYAKLNENEKEVLLMLQKAFYTKRIESLNEDIERLTIKSQVLK